MAPTTEAELLSSAFETLAQLLPGDDMEIVRLPGEGDVRWELRATDARCPVLPKVFRRFIPRDVDRLRTGDPAEAPILVIAPWISPRSQAALSERGFNYLDVTGNVRLRVARPAVFLRLDGARRDPFPPVKRAVRLRGAATNALIRVLVDFAPPYKLVDLAAVSGLSNGYVSRVLETLTDDRLIRRALPGKTVTDVDWRQLLVARGENYSLLNSNRSRTFIARGGVNSLLRELVEAIDDEVLITGSFAAQEFAPIAAPAQLALYVPDAEAFARRHALVPAEAGANVVLLGAADPSQLSRPRARSDGAFQVGLSQLVQDCLAGNGRLPEEGEALLEWMTDNQSVWRESRLPVARTVVA